MTVWAGHRNNEKALGVNPVIGPASFGATRTFNFRLYRERGLKETMLLEHGRLLLMQDDTSNAGPTVSPKGPKVSAARINITFRAIR